jgi:2-phosphosulfolactate phosphatase
VNQTKTQPPTTGTATQVLDAALLPSLVDPEFFAGKTVVVVDVLRATTTITAALHAGCRYVLPQGSIDAAWDAFDDFESDPTTAGSAKIGGERNGKIVDGFHQGNSPVEYTPAAIADKILILATTNGTVAMEKCRLADRVIIGSMVNLSAVAAEVMHDENVVVLCSGTDKLITSEDIIFAGALLQRIWQLRSELNLPTSQLTDPALIATNHWTSVSRQIDDGATLAHFFKNARGGVNLARIGHMPDIEFAANIDSLPLVSELNLKTWQIREIDRPAG